MKGSQSGWKVKVMRFVELRELKNKNYKEGEKILLDAGYKQKRTTKDTIYMFRFLCEDDDDDAIQYSIITYFALSDENDNAIDNKVFLTFYNYIPDETSDDEGKGFTVKDFWDEIEFLY